MEPGRHTTKFINASNNTAVGHKWSQKASQRKTKTIKNLLNWPIPPKNIGYRCTCVRTRLLGSRCDGCTALGTELGPWQQLLPVESWTWHSYSLCLAMTSIPIDFRYFWKGLNAPTFRRRRMYLYNSLQLVYVLQLDLINGNHHCKIFLSSESCLIMLVVSRCFLPFTSSGTSLPSAAWLQGPPAL